jgi:hypothetical protein
MYKKGNKQMRNEKEKYELVKQNRQLLEENRKLKKLIEDIKERIINGN